MTKQELLKILETSYKELVSLTADEVILLNYEITKNNPKAMAIKSWMNEVSSYYFTKKEEILNETSTVINFDAVGLMPYKFEDLKDTFNVDDTSEYRIAPYVDVPFSDSKINFVDFKRDLKPEVYLEKTTYRGHDGRPTLNEYHYNGELMATIKFEFEADENNIIISRKEILNYIKNDGSKSMDILIKNKTFDSNNPSDMAMMVKERIQAREYIIGYIQIFTLGVMKNYNTDKTHDEVVDMLMPYWDECEEHRLKFLEVGLQLWRDDIAAIDLDTTEHTFMGYVIDGDGTTLKDYLIYLLTY